MSTNETNNIYFLLFSHTGVTRSELRSVHWITTTLLTIFQNCILVMLILILTDYLSTYKFLMILLIACVHANNGISLGILLYVLYRRKVKVVLFILIIEIILTLICGIIWPWQGLPYYMKQIALLLPHRHIVDAFQCVGIMNLTILNRRVSNNNETEYL